MRRFLTQCLLALALAGLPASVSAADTASAPIAGARTSGGDDGRLIKVTNLNDSGPGSLREAVTTPGARKIVFTVGGEISLARSLIVDHPRMTIAGETAPSPGITLRGSTLRIKASDVIVRHLRIRVGDGPGEKPEDRDGIAILGSPKGTRIVENVLIDHCSVSWAIDEGISTWFDGVRNVTIRNSIVAETLNRSIHPKQPHSMGVLVGGKSRTVLIHRNLMAHNGFRNPVFSPDATGAVINNLIYNPGFNAVHVYGGPADKGPTLMSVVGNLVIAGPSTRPAVKFFSKQGVTTGSRIYLHGNEAQGTVAFETRSPELDALAFNPIVPSPPIGWPEDIEIVPAAALPALLAPDVGARPWDRDATDTRILREMAARGGQIRDTVPEEERR
ncbi:hypothetical protein [Iodidimonas sp. SYSU 1G8]|uniref:hypothetical protein n=1 Tax=Iodidimonas sp. SYSU 1G8 TaxID=3133967 RepID=UPI0031FE8A63